MRLSQAMTVKMAVANADRGGGKAVLAVPALPEGAERRALLLRYAKLVTSLGGTYRTAGDMNITPADLDVVAETCPWVYGTTGAGGNSGRGTAIGVLRGDPRERRAPVRIGDLAGRSVLVQGVGSVGHKLARLLAAERADVLVSDVEQHAPGGGGRGRRNRVAAESALETECDVYSPCAVGGTLNADRFRSSRAR